MADFDDFTAAENVENNEKDLVADFLSREQDSLAGIGDIEIDNLAGQSDALAGQSDVKGDLSDPFAEGQEYGNVSSTQNYDPFSDPANDYGQTEDHSSDPYNQVKHMDKQRAEPEKLRIWREEQVEMLLKKDAESECKKAEWREDAKRELEEWYKHRNEQVEKAKKVNRENEDAFILQRDERKPGGEWERVCRQCDFNPKGSRSSKDVSRMRSILLQLKQTPIER